ALAVGPGVLEGREAEPVGSFGVARVEQRQAQPGAEHHDPHLAGAAGRRVGRHAEGPLAAEVADAECGGGAVAEVERCVRHFFAAPRQRDGLKSPVPAAPGDAPVRRGAGGGPAGPPAAPPPPPLPRPAARRWRRPPRPHFPARAAPSAWRDLLNDTAAAFASPHTWLYSASASPAARRFHTATARAGSAAHVQA